MVKDNSQPFSEKKKFLRLPSDVNGSIEPSSGLFSPKKSPSDKEQDYFPFRSAEYKMATDHCNKQQSLSPNPININQSYLTNLTNMDHEENVQEYRRYRTAKKNTPARLSLPDVQHFIFPCYSQLTHQNENEYSRFRDSRSPRKKSFSGFDNMFLKPHTKCRSLNYDKDMQRFPVPDDKVSWVVTFCDYTPFEYTTKRVQENPKADPIDPWKIDNFNQLSKKIDRRSFTGTYFVDPITNRPRNPMGRTGLTGRGRLYYWGPNHAGDPVVTRWLRDVTGAVIRRRVNAHDQPKPVLEFVAIQRRDTKQWALPGGMVDPGEKVCETVRREFLEEAVRDGGDKTYIEKLFSNGYTLYEAYVDDPRNTDNAWIETVAVHFHDETGELTEHIHLHAGDDAENVVWRQIDRNLELYASHKDIIKVVVDRLDAYW